MFKEILIHNQQKRNRYHKTMKRRQALRLAAPMLTKFHAVKSRKQVPQRRPFKAASLGGGESNLTKQKIIILGEKNLENHIVNLKKKLEENKFECTIQYTKLIKPTNTTIFLISPRLLTYIPENFFFYQVEQLNQMSTDHTSYKFITKLAKKSIQTFDYSKTNIKYYPKNIHVEYFPFNLSIKTQPLEKIHDIVFFGRMDFGLSGNVSTRRKKILQKLSQKFKIYITNEVYSKELTKIINQSKIMLNLHFYDNAILETARLQEAVGLNTHIISEYPCEEDMEAIEPYKDRVEFVDVIKDDLSNIHLLEEKIEELLKGEKEVPVWENKIVNNLDLLCYPHLFHKYILGLSTADDPIKYEIVQQEDVSGNYFAHLHCYDISKFDEIYGEYIKTIETYFNIVITYSIGEKKIDKYTVLKIPNRGLDIGAKFCMVQYLKGQNEDYSHILFLHSKTDVETRKKYFGPLISAIKENEFIENINDYDGYFPDIQWEIQGDKLKMISGNRQFAHRNLPERNLGYRNELLDYLGCENRTNRFVEGNVYLLSKKIVERLFGDKKLYNILNRPDDFDYNWVCKEYGLGGSIRGVHRACTARGLPLQSKLRDACIEHTFERVMLNVCDNYKMIHQKKILFIGDIIINKDLSYECLNSCNIKTMELIKLLLNKLYCTIDFLNITHSKKIYFMSINNKNNLVCTEINSDNNNQNYAIVYTYIDHLNQLKPYINKTRCILSINAIHCLENPVPWHNNRFNNEITNFINYNNKNIITTSNERMKNYILKNNDISENKILINRIGFSDINNYTSINRNESRKTLIKCNNDDIVFINSGGIWAWTDFNTFLQAFIICVKKHNCKFKLIIPGMIQSNNYDKTNLNYQNITNNIFKKNIDLLENGTIIKHSWSSKQLVYNYLIGSDIGINVSQKSQENYYSERVRIADYKMANIKILNTEGDLFSIERPDNEKNLNVISGDVSSYISKLLEINNNNDLLKINKQFYSLFKWENTLKSLINKFN